jgi:hypothetical protein
LGFMLQPNLQIKAFSNLDKVLQTICLIYSGFLAGTVGKRNYN